jgi:lysophospholipase L1-like esterase
MLIVALGDSTTAGTPLYRSPIEAPPDGRGDHQSQYAYWLVEKRPFWRVLNRGVNGERTDEIAARFDRDVLERRPHGVVIIAGVNDVYQGKSVEHVTAELRKLYDRSADAGIVVVAGSILPYDDATKAQNETMARINAWIKAEAAKDPNVSFVDTRKAVASKSDRDKLASTADGHHPDVEGYRRMAAVIEPVLARVVDGVDADRRAARRVEPSGSTGRRT